jgi:hypothetical protein
VTSELPEQANLLMVFNVQSYLRIIASVLGDAGKDADAKLADLPKEPAFFAISSTYRPAGGYEFHLIIPSEVGTVVAKAIPMFQGIVPGANP